MQTKEAISPIAAMNFSLAMTCATAVDKCLRELGLDVASAKAERIGPMEKWTISLLVESSYGANVSIIFNGSAELATPKSMEGQ